MRRRDHRDQRQAHVGLMQRVAGSSRSRTRVVFFARRSETYTMLVMPPFTDSKPIAARFESLRNGLRQTGYSQLQNDTIDMSSTPGKRADGAGQRCSAVHGPRHDAGTNSRLEVQQRQNAGTVSGPLRTVSESLAYATSGQSWNLQLRD